MKLQLKSGRYYYLLKHLDRRGYRWVPLSHDPEERARQREALDDGRSVEEVFGDQAPGAWIGAHVDLMLKRVRERARASDIYCDLSADNIRAIGNEQRWRCALTGILFSLDRTDGARSRPFAPSIDRIRNDEGYTKGELQARVRGHESRDETSTASWSSASWRWPTAVATSCFSRRSALEKSKAWDTKFKPRKKTRQNSSLVGAARFELATTCTPCGQPGEQNQGLNHFMLSARRWKTLEDSRGYGPRFGGARPPAFRRAKHYRVGRFFLLTLYPIGVSLEP